MTVMPRVKSSISTAPTLNEDLIFTVHNIQGSSHGCLGSLGGEVEVKVVLKTFGKDSLVLLLRLSSCHFILILAMAFIRFSERSSPARTRTLVKASPNIG